MDPIAKVPTPGAKADTDADITIICTTGINKFITQLLLIRDEFGIRHAEVILFKEIRCFRTHTGCTA